MRPIGQAERGRLHAVEIRPRVHAKLTPRLIAGLDVTQAGTLQIQSRQVILVSAEVSTVEFNPAASLRLSGERHLAKPDRCPLCHAPMLAKNGGVAIQRDPAHIRFHGNSGLRCRPIRPLIDPTAYQRDLIPAQCRCLAFRRHLHVLDQSGDVMHQRTPFAVAGMNGHTRITALDRSVATGHLITSFRPFLAVALEAGSVENRLDFRGEIHPSLDGAWQTVFAHRLLSNTRCCAYQNGDEQPHQ